MQTIKKTNHSLKSSKEVDFSCIMVVYKAKNGAWRGFAHPYDVTIEADSRTKALNALKDMVGIYEEGLKKYNNPSHLALKHLSDKEDNEKFSQLALDLIAKQGKIKGSDYYAETKAVPA